MGITAGRGRLARSVGREFRGSERFEIRRQIGEGGMGVVYEALDHQTQTRVALKTLRWVDANALYRLKREFRALQDIEHPNLVQLGELVEEKGQWFFTMELIEGVDFIRYVRSDGAANGVDERRLRDVAGQLASGLVALHGAGRVHRDVKPSNAMVTTEGRVVLLDFGLSATTDAEDMSSVGEVVGTCNYMAPEQALQAEVHPAADWYSFGVILYEALTGRPPHAASTALEAIMKKQSYAPPPPRALVPDVAVDLDQLCAGLLAIDPERRPTGDAVLERLGASPASGASAGRTPRAVVSQLTETAPFLGRADELAFLRAAFDEVVAGQPRAVTVVGESGLGKSALIRVFTQDIGFDRGDAVILSGRCYERESVPYKAFDGVVDALSRYARKLGPLEAVSLLPPHAALLPRVFPVLGRVDAIAKAPRVIPPVQDPQELRARVFAALKWLLFTLAERNPLVVVIDDLQWADADSLRLISELIQPPDPPSLLLLMASRPHPDVERVLGPSLPAGVEHRRLGLGPLDVESGVALAQLFLERRMIDTDVSPASIAVEAKGHPLYIAELVRHMETAGSGSEQRLRLDEAIWKRACELPEPARRLLEGIAIAGAPLPEATIRQAAEVEQVELARQLSVLRVASLVRTTRGRGDRCVEPYHDRVREAVVASLDEARARDWHGRLARAFEERGGADAEVLVRHWREAGDSEKASHYAETAAAQAVQALAFDRAARLYELALGLREHEPAEERGLRVRLADALADAGSGAESAEQYVRAAEGAAAAEALELRRRASEQWLFTGHFDRGLEAIRSVLDMVGMHYPSTPKSALISLLRRRAWIRLRGLRHRERDASQVSAEELTRVDILWSVSAGLSQIDTIRGADFQARHLLHALKSGEPYRVSRGLTLESAYHSTRGIRAKKHTLRLSRAGRELAERIDDPHALGFAAEVAGIGAFLRGEWKEARRLCANAEMILRDQCTGTTWELTSARAFLLGAMFYLGDLTELAQLVPLRLQEAAERGNLYAATGLRSWRTNVAWLALDDPDEARRQVERANREWSRSGFHLQHYYELLAHCQIDLYCGDGPAAWDRVAERWNALAGSLLLRVQNVRVESHHLRARAALATAARTEDARLLRCASRDARHLAREGVGWARALALLVRAGVSATAGDRGGAITHLEEAEEEFEAVDMRLYAAACRYRRGQLQSDAAGSGDDAEAHREIAAMGARDPARMVAMLAPGF